MTIGSERRYLLTALIIACLTRIFSCWYLSSNLTNDLDAYVGIAQSLSDGRGFSTPGTTNPTAYRPPLFPLLLAPFIPLVGMKFSVALIQIVFFVGTVCLTCLLGIQLGLRRGALFAALLVAVDPLLLYYGSFPMNEVCCAGLMTAWLLLLVKPHLALPGEHDPQARSPSRSWMQSASVRRFSAGAIFGLAALCRPTVWVVGVMYAGYWFIQRMIEYRKNTKSSSRVSSVDTPVQRVDANSMSHALRRFPFAAVCGVACIVAPWLIRNLIVLHAPIVTTTHGGYTLLLANNPTFYREVVDQTWGAYWESESLTRWQDDLDHQMEEDSPPAITEPQRDRWMYREAYRVIGGEPMTFLKACGKRFLWFWNITPLVSHNEKLPSLIYWVIGGYYLVFTGCVVVGIMRMAQMLHADKDSAASETTRRRAWLLLLLPLLGFTFVHLFYWTNMRMRAPIVPMLALLAVLACVKPEMPSGRGSQDEL